MKRYLRTLDNKIYGCDDLSLNEWVEVFTDTGHPNYHYNQVITFNDYLTFNGGGAFNKNDFSYLFNASMGWYNCKFKIVNNNYIASTPTGASFKPVQYMKNNQSNNLNNNDISDISYFKNNYVGIGGGKTNGNMSLYLFNSLDTNQFNQIDIPDNSNVTIYRGIDCTEKYIYVLGGDGIYNTNYLYVISEKNGVYSIIKTFELPNVCFDLKAINYNGVDKIYLQWTTSGYSNAGGLLIYSYSENTNDFILLKKLDILNGTGTSSTYANGYSTFLEDINGNIIFVNTVGGNSNYSSLYINKDTNEIDYYIDRTYGPISVFYKEAVIRKENITGNKDTVDISSTYINENNESYSVKAYPDEELTITITPKENYILKNITSQNGTVNLAPTVATITYNNINYVEDSIDIVSESSKVIDSGKYLLNGNQTINVTYEANVNGRIIVNNNVFIFNKIYTEGNKLYCSGKYENSQDLINKVDLFPYEINNYIEFYEDFIAPIELYNIINSGTTNTSIDNKINVEVDSRMSYTIRGNVRQLNNGNYFSYGDWGVILNVTASGYYVNNVTSNYGVITKEDKSANVGFIGSGYTSEIQVKANTTTGSFVINLFKLKCESIVVDKEAYLESTHTLRGNLKGPCSIKRPVIVVNTSEIPNYNYAYIKAFNRYYFIDDFVNVGWNLWQLSLRADVLFSFKKDIQASTGFISRNENHYEDHIYDNLEPLNPHTFVDTIKIQGESNKFEIDYLNGFNVTDTETGFNAYVQLTGIESISTENMNAQLSYINFDGVGSLPEIIGTSRDSQIVGFVMKSTEIYKLIRLLNENNLQSNFISARVYPFSLPYSSSEDKGIVNIGDLGKVTTLTFVSGKSINIESFAMYQNIQQENNYYKLISFTYYQDNFSDFNILNHMSDFLYYSSRYEVFLPFASWYEMQVNKILNKNIKVVYSIDLSSGNEIVNILSNFDLIYSTSCNLSKSFPISFDNSKDVENQRALMNINNSIGMLNSGLNATQAFVSLNATGAISGTMSTYAKAKSVGIQNELLYVKTSSSIPSGEIGLYSPIDVFVKRTYQISQLTTDNEKTTYLATFGKPLNKPYNTLNEYTGFTVISSIHISSTTATEDELKEIENIVASGIIL